jgi:hypothetical protein
VRVEASIMMQVMQATKKDRSGTDKSSARLVWNSVHAEFDRKDLVTSLKILKKSKGSGEIALSLDACLDGGAEELHDGAKELNSQLRRLKAECHLTHGVHKQ